MKESIVENEVIFTEEDLVIQGYSGAGKAFPRFITDFTEEGGEKNNEM